MEDYKVTRKPRMMVVGITCRTSNDSNAGPHDIPRLWQKFYADDILSKISNKTSEDVIVLYCDYEKDHTGIYSCVIGCKVSSLEQIPSGMVGKVIPASTFAVFRAVGDFPTSLIHTWGHIWQLDVQRTYAGDYEVYGQKFASDKEVDVLVAMEG